MKRGTLSSSIVAEVLCLSLAVAGIWVLLARPLHARLERAAHDAANARSGIKRMTAVLESDPITPREATKLITTHASEIQSRCELAGDPSLLYEAIGEIARAEGVGIERMDPKRINVTSTSSTKGRGLKSERKSSDAPSVGALGYSIEVTGTYSEIAAFIDAIERRAGMSKVVSFRLMPGRDASNPDALRGNIETAHYGLSKKVLAAADRETD